MTPSTSYDFAISRANVEADDEETGRLRDLEALVNASLGYSLDNHKFQALAQIQVDTWSAHQHLSGCLDAGHISEATYLARLNETMNNDMERRRSLLGSSDFEKVFGEQQLHNGAPIDPEIFLDSRAESR